MGKPSGQAQTLPYVGEITDDEDGLLLTATVTQNPSGPNEQITKVTERLFELELNPAEPAAMLFTPEDGDSINSVGDPQIKFEWRDGTIAKVINPFLASELERVRFVRSRQWLIILNIGILAIIVGAAYWKWRKTKRGILLLVICLSTSNTLRAESGPYCGIYSLYGAARSLGVDANIDNLIAPQYISSTRGSTAADLVRAAQSVGLQAVALWGLGVNTLKAAELPLILHASALGSHGAYDHWILFLGFDETGRARVVDGAGGVALCTTEEILARWDGIAIAIGQPNSAPTRYLSVELAGLLFLVVYGSVFALVVKSRMLVPQSASEKWHCDTLIHVAALAAVSIGAGYASKGQGYRAAAKGIEVSLGLRQAPTVGVEELLERLRNGAVLIDCRYERDYELGHIQGAISVPVDIGLGDFARVLADIDRHTNLIVYCQSSECGFSAYVATMLAGAGFRNVTVFKDGFEGWKRRFGTDETIQTTAQFLHGIDSPN
jgi:rhodanese-related sulfurtransferase